MQKCKNCIETRKFQKVFGCSAALSWISAEMFWLQNKNCEILCFCLLEHLQHSRKKQRISEKLLLACRWAEVWLVHTLRSLYGRNIAAKQTFKGQKKRIHKPFFRITWSCTNLGQLTFCLQVSRTFLVFLVITGYARNCLFKGDAGLCIVFSLCAETMLSSDGLNIESTQRIFYLIYRVGVNV